jgi:hypothetical protein
MLQKITNKIHKYQSQLILSKVLSGPCAISIPDLPKNFTQGAAAVLDGVVYYCGGMHLGRMYSSCYLLKGRNTFFYTTYISYILLFTWIRIQ